MTEVFSLISELVTFILAIYSIFEYVSGGKSHFFL